MSLDGPCCSESDVAEGTATFIQPSIHCSTNVGTSNEGRTSRINTIDTHTHAHMHPTMDLSAGNLADT